MKKNTMMRIASILLIAVLLSTSAISGTYAKYVTADNASDTARVAKFGVVATVDGTLFAKNYINATGGNTPADSGELTVISQTTDKVVAPGTKSLEDFTVSLTGQPEVDVFVKFEFVATKEIKLDKDTSFDNPTTGKVDPVPYVVDADYYPVIFTLKNDAGTVLAKGNVAAINAYMSGNLNKTYNAGTNLATIAGGTTGEYVLTWEWAFENYVSDVDVKDTYLGNAAAATYFGESFPTDGAEVDMDVKLTLTVTQVD